jgi:hypothetical protein
MKTKEEIIKFIENTIIEFWDNESVEVRQLQFAMNEVYKTIRNL